MPLSYNQYSGNGTAKVFNLTFPYIHRDHIEIKVNGYDQAFSWNSPTQVALVTAPAKDAVIDIRRVTPRDEVMVNFQDASTLVETDLDLSALQVFYIAQEALDMGEASLGVNADGSFNALLRRISNVLDPELPQDVANKRWVETAHSSQLKQSTDQANKSTVSADRSDTRASASEASAVRSEKAAASSESSAERSNVRADASEASAVRSEAAARATDADRKETALNVTRSAEKVTEAAGHAKDAKESADRAGLFDPTSYYTKTEVDNKKLDKSGGTINGSLAVQGNVLTLKNGAEGAQAPLIEFRRMTGPVQMRLYQQADGSVSFDAYDHTSGAWLRTPLTIKWGGGIRVDSNMAVGGATYETNGNIWGSIWGTHLWDYLNGRSWHDVSGQRYDNTDYVNNTGRPILVSMWVNGTADRAVEVWVNGLLVAADGGWDGDPRTSFCSAIIPAGATYRIRAQGNRSRNIRELR